MNNAAASDAIRDSRIASRSGHSLVSANKAQRRIDDYAATAGARINQVRGYSGNQPGDPVRAAHAIAGALSPLTRPTIFLWATLLTMSRW
jgi:hypothetical protein